ncbi:unnamed protein product [Owenia fusiformis]|uniref:Uncharacterized protein n=1 Tax=Owenia fusiformis TaxID=6347 RepID=A0A8J1T731_OWEFU|nr:unnamed protein product [Owenia fusiformis]
METSKIQFVGKSCGKHGQYTFFKALKYSRGEKYRIVSLGEFFFLKVSDNSGVGIGELQLLWEEKGQPIPLVSVRLYFLPENTPDGRHKDHGKDEILAVAEKIVLKGEDLVNWIIDDPNVTWDQGHLPTYIKPTSQSNSIKKAFAINNPRLELGDVNEEKNALGDLQVAPSNTDVLIVSYSTYCRYKAVLKRLEGCTDKWLTNAVVQAIGGITVSKPNTRILFCRQTFESEDIQGHKFRCEHLAPNLKGRPRKRKVKLKDGMDSDSASNDADYQQAVQNSLLTSMKEKLQESKEKPIEKQRPNGVSSNKTIKGNGQEMNEQEFLVALHQFMRERGTPIERIPSLGFKTIDLYLFYTFAQKLGGYTEVSQKRLWKYLYDNMGGNPNNTAAATCTRRNYEKLLLPFERHVKGDMTTGDVIPVNKHPGRKRVSDIIKENEKLLVPNVDKRWQPQSSHNASADVKNSKRELEWEERRKQILKQGSTGYNHRPLPPGFSHPSMPWNQPDMSKSVPGTSRQNVTGGSRQSIPGGNKKEAHRVTGDVNTHITKSLGSMTKMEHLRNVAPGSGYRGARTPTVINTPPIPHRYVPVKHQGIAHSCPISYPPYTVKLETYRPSVIHHTPQGESSSTSTTQSNTNKRHLPAAKDHINPYTKRKKIEKEPFDPKCFLPKDKENGNSGDLQTVALDLCVKPHSIALNSPRSQTSTPQTPPIPSYDPYAIQEEPISLVVRPRDGDRGPERTAITPSVSPRMPSPSIAAQRSATSKNLTITGKPNSPLAVLNNHRDVSSNPNAIHSNNRPIISHPRPAHVNTQAAHSRVPAERGINVPQYSPGGSTMVHPAFALRPSLSRTSSPGSQHSYPSGSLPSTYRTVPNSSQLTPALYKQYYGSQRK